jgi:hypothetical protein
MYAYERRPAPNSRESRLSWSELYRAGPAIEKEATAAEIFSAGSMRFPHARFTIFAAFLAVPVVACGGSSSQTTSSATPLTPAQIQARYSAAASHYNQTETQIALTENSSCDAASATVALGACQTALSAQRQLTIAYDSALRAIPFSGSAATAAAHLLGDDAAIEKLLEQAATAPAITVITTLQQQVIALLATAAADATALRQAIGLPAPA